MLYKDVILLSCSSVLEVFPFICIICHYSFCCPYSSKMPTFHVAYHKSVDVAIKHKISFLDTRDSVLKIWMFSVDTNIHIATKTHSNAHKLCLPLKFEVILWIWPLFQLKQQELLHTSKSVPYAKINQSSYQIADYNLFLLASMSVAIWTDFNIIYQKYFDSNALIRLKRVVQDLYTIPDRKIYPREAMFLMRGEMVL